jgi:hypothetical protein
MPAPAGLSLLLLEQELQATKLRRPTDHMAAVGAQRSRTGDFIANLTAPWDIHDNGMTKLRRLNPMDAVSLAG